MVNDYEESDRDCPKCGETLAERRCDAIYCDGGTVADPDDDWHESERCDECNGTGFQVWCRSCGWDVTDSQFLSPQYEAEWMAKQEKREAMMSDNLQFDWTRNELGASNSSDTFNRIVGAVAQLIRNEAASLIDGNISGAARLIVAQLAHVHGLAPEATARQAAAQAAYEQACKVMCGHCRQLVAAECLPVHGWAHFVNDGLQPRGEPGRYADCRAAAIRALAAAEAGKEGKE